MVVDAKRGFDDETRSIIAKLRKHKMKAVLVLNKVDLVQKEKLLGSATSHPISEISFAAKHFAVDSIFGNGTFPISSTCGFQSS